jgi:hypothetical protein
MCPGQQRILLPRGKKNDLYVRTCHLSDDHAYAKKNIYVIPTTELHRIKFNARANLRNFYYWFAYQH